MGHLLFCCDGFPMAWSPQVERVHEGPTGKVVYGIGYDDGDKEDGVLAGRVRSPGQTSPPLRASLAVEVKLARKGKVRFV